MSHASSRKSNIVIPEEVRDVIQKLTAAGFPSYAVGGCVRDLVIGRGPRDWDVATSATPEEIQKLFPDSFYANKFFTVTVKTGSPDDQLSEIEVTTFRSEGHYEDLRHPSDVKPAETIEEDLARRDFTVNAMAIGFGPGEHPEIIDPYGGERDCEARTIRAVGDPNARFAEDALRMLRAVRLSAELEFTIDAGTEKAIQAHAGTLRAISKERIRDEFSKVVMADGTGNPAPKPGPAYGTKTDIPGESDRARMALLPKVGASRAWQGMEFLHALGLLREIIPELEEGIGCTQNKHHIYTVWEHNMRALDYAAMQRWPLTVRIAALFHDIAKPHTKKGEGPDSTFYGHDVVGSKMSAAILLRLRYPSDLIEKVTRLVRWHLFRYDYEGDEVETTDSSIRRLIRNIGVENIENLVRVRMCDRIGSGVPKAVPYRLRHFQFRVEKVLREKEAVTVGMLAIRGEDIMRILGITPGPKVGHVLNALLEEVLDDPKKNTHEYLEERAKELGKYSEDDLMRLRKKAETRVNLIEDEREGTIKQKYAVK